MNEPSTQSQQSLDHFFRGAFSVDIVLFTFHENTLKILVERKADFPFENELGLPGKLILPNEDAGEAMDTFMDKSIGRHDFYTKQLKTFSAVNRHPLGRIISFAFYGLVPHERVADSIDERFEWHDLDGLPKLCADHDQIVKAVRKRFRKGLLRHPIVFELLPESFILSEVVDIYEQAFGQSLDKPNFRKKVLKSGLVEATGKFQEKGIKFGRPAEFYRARSWNKKVFKEKVSFNFEA